MGDKDQSKAPVVNQQPSTGPTSAAPVTSAQVAQVQTMIAQGGTPGDVAGFIEANPGARDEIMTYLHGGPGNTFVQQVMLAAGPTTPPPDPLVGGADMLSFTFPVDDQVVQVYVSPGGI